MRLLQLLSALSHWQVVFGAYPLLLCMLFRLKQLQGSSMQGSSMQS